MIESARKYGCMGYKDLQGKTLENAETVRIALLSIIGKSFVVGHNVN